MLGTSQYSPKLTSTWPVQPVFKPVQNVSFLIPIYVSVRYIPAGMAGTDTMSTTLQKTNWCLNLIIKNYHQEQTP